MSELGYLDLVETLNARDDGYQCKIPDNWRQGRTAYGGVTAALSYETAQRQFADLPPIRSMQTTFVGPVGEDVTFKASRLRQGKNVSTINVDAVVEGDVVARTVFIFGKTRASVLSDQFPAPTVAAPEDTEPFHPRGAEKFLPSFIRNFDMKLSEGARPISGADEAYIRVWARHRDQRAHNSMAAFICLGDVLPPAAMPTFKSFGPVSSVNWQVNFLAPELQTRDGWWDIENRQTAAQDGYSSQVMRYWNRDGVLMAEAIQSVAIFI